MLSVAEDKGAPQGGQAAGSNDSARIVNDFAISVATANGTGSQTSNQTIIRTLFNMGIPVNGKNIFPSNIQGMPTWFQIRASHEGFVARRHTSEIIVAFNEATVQEDIEGMPAGGVCLYNEDFKNVTLRDDVVNYRMPVKQLVRAAGVKGKLRSYVANMVYVGTISWLLSIELSEIEQALAFHFGNRQALVDQNMAMVRIAFDWATENLEKNDPYSVERMEAMTDTILITGNEASGMGTVFGGATFVAWYPITPSTGVIDAVNDYMPKLRRDPESGRNNYAVIQAEDELAAVGMILGAGWAGARSMTATSGPGLSLMAEFIGLGYQAEIPAVIWNIQRVGPSTGLPTRTAQGDVLFAYYLGHGDTRNVILFPGTVAECFDDGIISLDIAEQLQTPVIVLSDLDLGMNTWMTKKFDYPSEPLKRGKVLSAEDVESLGFARYKDIDGDGITYRTLPGNEHPKAAYFTRGSGHDENAFYSERADVFEANMERLNLKFETAKTLVPSPIIDEVEGTEIGIIAFGSTMSAIDEARARLGEQGIATSSLRLRSLPLCASVRTFIEKHERVYVTELNRDGQMHRLLISELPDLADRLRSLCHIDGMPLTAHWVTDNLIEKEQQR